MRRTDQNKGIGGHGAEIIPPLLQALQEADGHRPPAGPGWHGAESQSESLILEGQSQSEPWETMGNSGSFLFPSLLWEGLRLGSGASPDFAEQAEAVMPVSPAAGSGGKALERTAFCG